jgi:hypothetical protein
MLRLPLPAFRAFNQAVCWLTFIGTSFSANIKQCAPAHGDLGIRSSAFILTEFQLVDLPQKCHPTR